MLCFQQLNDSDFGMRNGLPDRVPHISNHNSSHLVSLHSSCIFKFRDVANFHMLFLVVVDLCFKNWKATLLQTLCFFPLTLSLVTRAFCLFLYISVVMLFFGLWLCSVNPGLDPTLFDQVHQCMVSCLHLQAFNLRLITP